MITVARATVAAAILVAATTAGAQDPPVAAQDSASAIPDSPYWTWTTDGSVFVGYNYQKRLFADFYAWESQNWFMATATRTSGSGQLTIRSMLSLEPFTLGRLVYAGDRRLTTGGSPQLFQTGESYRGSPLVNYQHPHDLVMGLGATYRVQKAATVITLGADLVGSPTLGPTPFMHRDSARENPQVPLTHHFLDATHSTTGVLRGGIEARGISVEASAFRGEEPNENRLNIDRPRLDSWAARVGWRRGPWQAQFSGGRLHEPEWFEPYDMTRLTASLAYSGSVGAWPLAITLAWGENREFTPFRGVSDGYLLEADVRPWERTSIYLRGELARKEIFGLGFHPKGFGHPHIYSDVDALTFGAVRDLSVSRWGRIGPGADLTVYRMSPDVRAYYGGSKSFHAFVRWRPNTTSVRHVH